jgi:hypothetical protein
MEDAEKGAPRANGFAVLVGEDTRELVQVSEIVGGPGGEELGERDGAEGGVTAATVHVIELQIEGAQAGEAFGAELGELVQEFGERFGVLWGAEDRWEGLGIAVLEDELDAREPVGALSVDEMAEYGGGVPGGVAFVGCGPGDGEVAQESVEGSWCLSEQGDGVVEGLVHCFLG